jgi:hypothetical protein
MSNYNTKPGFVERRILATLDQTIQEQYSNRDIDRDTWQEGFRAGIEWMFRQHQLLEHNDLIAMIRERRVEYEVLRQQAMAANEPDRAAWFYTKFRELDELLRDANIS